GRVPQALDLGEPLATWRAIGRLRFRSYRSRASTSVATASSTRPAACNTSAGHFTTTSPDSMPALRLLGDDQEVEHVYGGSCRCSAVLYPPRCVRECRLDGTFHRS